MGGNWLQDLSLWDFIKLMMLVPIQALKDAFRKKKGKKLDSGSGPE